MRHIAIELGAPWWELNDLCQEGRIGFLSACRDYKPTVNCAFETYARYRIRGAMLDYLRRIDPLSRQHRQHVRAGRLPMPALMMDESTCEPAEIELPGLLERLRRAIDALPVPERRVIRRQFFDDMRGSDVAAEMGVCHARVIQLRKQAMNRLRKKLTCATVGL